MSEHLPLKTERLLLRQWLPTDFTPFAELNADRRVMQYFPERYSRAQSDAIAERCQGLIEARGWGFWAVERRDSQEFIGFVGLHEPAAPLPFAPCVEIGWRLHWRHWHQGFATEAATAALAYGFEHLRLAQIVSFTAVINEPSQAVMRRLGMQRQPSTFCHPDVPAGHVLEEHVWYTLAAADFASR